MNSFLFYWDGKGYAQPGLLDVKDSPHEAKYAGAPLYLDWSWFSGLWTNYTLCSRQFLERGLLPEEILLRLYR